MLARASPPALASPNRQPSGVLRIEPMDDGLELWRRQTVMVP